MWKSYISSISAEYHFNDPATEAELTSIQDKLQIELPDELQQLYLETNGVFDKFGCPLIWSTDRVVEDNLNYRQDEDFKDLYMPFDHLLFFSDAGNGDLFGYAILNGVIQRTDVYAWNHEDDSRTWIASSLIDFIKRWVSGEISV